MWFNIRTVVAEMPPDANIIGAVALHCSVSGSSKRSYREDKECSKKFFHIFLHKSSTVSSNYNLHKTQIYSKGRLRWIIPLNIVRATCLFTTEACQPFFNLLVEHILPVISYQGE